MMRYLARGSAPTVATQDRSDPLARGLVLWLPLTERAGTRVRDGSGLGANATLQGTTTFVADGPNGSAVNVTGLSGSGVYITSNVGYQTPLGPSTLAIWVYFNDPTIPGSGSALITKAISNIPAPFDWYVHTHQFSVLMLGNGTSYSQSSGSGSGEYIFPAQQWIHLAVTLDSPSLTGFVAHYYNGRSYSSGNASILSGSGVPIDQGQPLIIGNRQDNATQANARFSDARIYNRALTPSEIRMLYLDGLRPWRAKPRPVVPKPAAVAPGYRARVVRWS
jgi:hypothetical protein